MKDIRLFFSSLTKHVYASSSYKEYDDGLIEITGKKYDVTEQVKQISEQMRVKCRKIHHDGCFFQTCSECGNIMHPEDKYCWYCGAKVVG